MSSDRFKKIATNYGDLYREVFLEMGRSHDEMEQSVFRGVQKNIENFKDLPILDIGTGDGETIKSFVEAGCTKLTGLDLNEEMLIRLKAKFGEAVELIQGDALDLSRFEEGSFPIIISGNAIHNIAATERKGFWREIIRLKPRLFVDLDRIVDADPGKHKKNYDKEIKAVESVYKHKHGLNEAYEMWREHFIQDEKEQLTLEEFERELGAHYNLQVIFDMGLNKTVVARLK